MVDEPAGSVEVEIRAALEPFRRGLEAGRREARAFDRDAQRHMTGTRRAVAAMTAGVARARDTVFSLRGAIAGIGAGLAIRKVIRDFAEFESGLIGVGKTTGIAGQDLERLGEGVQGIAREVPVATTELLSIAQAAGQLGVSSRDNILAFTETVGQLGLASDLAGEQAATSLARILNVTGEATSDVDRLGSTLVQLGNNVAATEAEIADMATRVAQATAQFDVSAAEASGMGAAMREMGIRAEAGGTVVGRAFQAINDAVRQGGEEMEAFTRITGMTRDQLGQLFRDDSTAAFQALIEGLGQLSAEGGDVASALSDVGLEGVRVVQVMGTLAAQSSRLERGLNLANNGWEENRALTEEALVAAGSFTSQMQLAGNAINEASVEIGRALAPSIVDATEKLRDFIQEASDTGQIEEWAQNTGDAFKMLADNMDLAVTAGSALIGLRLGSAFGPWGAAIGLVTGGLIAYTQQLDSATTASQEHVEAMEALRDRLREVDGTNEEVAQSAREKAQEDLAAARAALQHAEAELRMAQTMVHPSRLVARDRARQAKEEYEALSAALEDVARQMLRIEMEAQGMTRTMPIQITPEEISALARTGDDPETDRRDAAADATQRQREQVEQLIADLQFEQALIGATAAEQEAMNNLRWAGAEATAEQRQQIMEETLALHDLREATLQAEEAQRFLGDAAFRALDEMIVRGRDAEEVMIRLSQAIASAALEAALLGQGPLAGLFGTSPASPGGVGGILGGVLGAVFHRGGVVGQTPTAHRFLPADAFDNAIRMHGGGMAGLRSNEVPAILERGERVIPKGQTASEGEAPIRVGPIYIQTPDAESFRRARGQIAADLARAVDSARRYR